MQSKDKSRKTSQPEPGECSLDSNGMLVQLVGEQGECEDRMKLMGTSF